MTNHFLKVRPNLLEDLFNELKKYSGIKDSLEIFQKGEIYNISDDKPASMEEVINYGTKLLGVDKPKTIEVDQLENEMLRIHKNLQLSWTKEYRSLLKEILYSYIGS